MTPLQICLASAVTLVASAVGSFILGRKHRVALWVATAGCLLAAVAGIAASSTVLLAGSASSLSIAWTLPMGAFHVGIDAISAYFVLVLFLVAAITSIYAAGYSLAHGEHHGPDHEAGWTNLMNAAMLLILLSRDAILFLMAWEVMSIVSFFLVTKEHDREDVRQAGFIYLAASHIGTVFIFLLFAWLYRNTGTLDFDLWMSQHAQAARFSGLAFVLGLVGFGTKAGIWPLHIWLPYAHPAAPSPVSAMMSCVMIKMGIYGIVRTLLFLASPSPWWGTALIVLGIVSGIVGVLLALAQNDYKRLLAYSSIENIGIISLGLGVGVLGQSYRQPSVAFFGFAGATLHVLNHALFKGLLFQTAGCVLLKTGQRNLNALGGLGKRMPVTAALFMTAAIAICGLPPFNGFISELLIYAGAFDGGRLSSSGAAILSIFGLVSLALIGGLALACFVKAYGVAFSGEPRSDAVHQVREVGPLLLTPMTLLALLCATLGLFPSLALRLVAPLVRAITRDEFTPSWAFEVARSLSRIELTLLGIAGLLLLARMALLRRRAVSRTATWGCGYAAPNARMQYSAGSFALPALATFRRLLATRESPDDNENPFPVPAGYTVQYHDLAADRGVFPIVRLVQRTASSLRVLQQGRIQLYLMYVFGALLAVLVWLLILGR